MHLEWIGHQEHRGGGSVRDHRSFFCTDGRDCDLEDVLSKGYLKNYVGQWWVILLYLPTQ
jgi:hypothetical protein